MRNMLSDHSNYPKVCAKLLLSLGHLVGHNVMKGSWQEVFCSFASSASSIDMFSISVLQSSLLKQLLLNHAGISARRKPTLDGKTSKAFSTHSAKLWQMHLNKTQFGDSSLTLDQSSLHQPCLQHHHYPTLCSQTKADRTLQTALQSSKQGLFRCPHNWY